MVQDPALLAWQRALGFQGAEAERGAATQIGQINDTTAFQQPIIAEDAQVQRRNIGFGREQVGLYDSSYTQQLLAENIRQQQRQQAALELDRAQQVGSVESDLAATLAGLERQRLEQELQAGLY